MSNHVYHVGGALKSPEDPRDHIAEHIMRRSRAAAIPETLDLRKNMQSVTNQGSQGTCSAQAAAAVREYQENVEFGLDQHMSPQFVYNLRSNYPSAGMYGRDVMSILLKNGICREVTYPYNTIEPIEKIPSSAFNEAANHVIKEYAQVTTLAGLKQCLVENGPCHISYPVYNYSGRFWKQNTGDVYIGGHAVCVVGYDTNGFIIRNSWGTNWCDGGYTNYPYSDWGSHWEIWTVIDANTDDNINYNNDKNGCKCVIL